MSRLVVPNEQCSSSSGNMEDSEAEWEELDASQRRVRQQQLLAGSCMSSPLVATATCSSHVASVQTAISSL